MDSNQTVSTFSVATDFQGRVLSVSGDLNSLADSASSHLSYTSGSLSANKMLEVASKVDRELLRFMKSYVHDAEGFVDMAKSFVQLDETIANKADNISG